MGPHRARLGGTLILHFDRALTYAIVGGVRAHGRLAVVQNQGSTETSSAGTRRRRAGAWAPGRSAKS
jgi:hypothetical protein